MKKLYALVTNRSPQYERSVIIQVSFNKAELEEIADYLNQFKYFGPNAKVIEVDEKAVEWYWPRGDR